MAKEPTPPPTREAPSTPSEHGLSPKPANIIKPPPPPAPPAPPLPSSS